jgi:hypothetical protein
VLLALLLSAAFAHGQLIYVGQNFNGQTVSPPTFSCSPGSCTNPPLQYTGGPTSVTITQGAIPASGQTLLYCYSTSNCTPTTTYTAPISFTTSGSICAQATAATYISSPPVCWAGFNPNCSGTCKDTFSGTAGTLLANYNTAWLSYDDVFQVSHFQLGPSANEVESLSTSSDAGALYSFSTSNFSTLMFPAATGTTSVREVCVFATSNPLTGTNSGYCFRVDNPTTVGNPYTTGQFFKAGTDEHGVTFSVPSTSAIAVTLGVVASGSDEILTGYINGTSVGTFTDTSSVITSGNPGFIVDPLASSDNFFGEWCDYQYPC